ncbi:hypothetical protein BS78_K206800 [Paspalum vaginatum]|uniref:DDE Tnp4 domain-containing protein n=1 Tax=Paspalum vaginatum TaxID=158149 RepID=A0A9W7X817_9POAL|nr:hypothetical protein BS78_K206800 [Paspalum vaginatum]
MFLHVVGHNQRFRVIGVTFRRSVKTISRYFHQVLYVVGELHNDLIVPPTTNVHPRILNSLRWYPYFNDCIGAIDGTHVLARVPLKMQAAFRGRKHTTTQNGVRTDKGFKEIHVRAIAKQLTEAFAPQVFTANQLYNHLRKWWQRWVKVCRLKDISAALWDEDNYMIVLDDGHLMEYTKVNYPADAKFLNVPIENYLQMQILFCSGQATGRYAMASNEPLGVPTDLGQLEQETTINLSTDTESVKPTDHHGSRKRKRASEQDQLLTIGMTGAVQSVANAMLTPMHNELHPDPYSQEALMFALCYLLKNKAEGLCFVQMTEEHKHRTKACVLRVIAKLW